MALISTALFLAASVSSADVALEPTAPSRFHAQAQWQTAAPTQANTRFTLRASLVPNPASTSRPGERFVATAKLESSAKAICLNDGRIFANGFEGSD